MGKQEGGSKGLSNHESKAVCCSAEAWVPPCPLYLGHVVFFLRCRASDETLTTFFFVSRAARSKMKPESLLESDPINICLARKTKLPFRVLDETPNGSYGLVINGYSLVGSTEHLSAPLFRALYPRTTQLQEISLLYIPPWAPFPERHLSPGYSRQAYTKKVKPKRRRKVSLYSLFRFFLLTWLATWDKGANKQNRTLKIHLA